MDAKNKERVKSTSCGGVVWRVKDNNLDVLLIKQFSHKERWGIPKGHTHPGEVLEDCARREIREETGVVVELGQRLIDCVSIYRNEEKTVVSWLATVVGSDEPRHDDPDSEVADARWFTASALPDIHLYQRALISSAISRLNEMIDHKPTNG